MRNEISFPIKGTNYCFLTDAIIEKIVEQDLLSLVQEPDNNFDKGAIAVYWEDVKIGYVPNQGVSCSMCWRSVSGAKKFCESCGAGPEHFVDGGLATRLASSGMLKEDYVIYVSEIDLKSKHFPFKATISINKLPN